MFQSGGNISQPFKFGETVMAQCLRVLAALPEDHPHQGPSLLITAEAPGLFSGLQGHKHVLAHSCTHTLLLPLFPCIPKTTQGEVF